MCYNNWRHSYTLCNLRKPFLYIGAGNLKAAGVTDLIWKFVLYIEILDQRNDLANIHSKDNGVWLNVVWKTELSGWG